MSQPVIKEKAIAYEALSLFYKRSKLLPSVLEIIRLGKSADRDKKGGKKGNKAFHFLYTKNLQGRRCRNSHPA